MSTGSNNTVGWFKLWAACVPLCAKSDTYLHCEYVCVYVCVCACTVAPHRLSHLCPSAPVVSPRLRLPTMHCFHVNAFRHREIIFSFSALLFPLLFYHCIFRRFFSFSFFVQFFFPLPGYFFDSSVGKSSFHMLTGEWTQIIIRRCFLKKIYCAKTVLKDWSFVCILGSNFLGSTMKDWKIKTKEPYYKLPEK